MTPCFDVKDHISGLFSSWVKGWIYPATLNTRDPNKTHQVSVLDSIVPERGEK